MYWSYTLQKSFDLYHAISTLILYDDCDLLKTMIICDGCHDRPITNYAKGGGLGFNMVVTRLYFKTKQINRFLLCSLLLLQVPAMNTGCEPVNKRPRLNSSSSVPSRMSVESPNCMFYCPVIVDYAIMPFIFV